MAKIKRPPDPATASIRSPVSTSPAAVRAGSMHPSLVLLPVRRVADLEGNGVIGFLEPTFHSSSSIPNVLEASCSRSSLIL